MFAAGTKDPRPSNGFMSYFGNQPHNFRQLACYFLADVDEDPRPSNESALT